MSDDESPSPEISEAAKLEKAEDHGFKSLFSEPPGTDWFLCWLIALADDLRLEQGITLTLGAGMVTGTLISGREYFKAIGDQVKGGNYHGSSTGGDPKDFLENVGETYANFAEVYPPAPGSGAELRALKAVGATFIHLRDALFFTPNGPAPIGSGVFWRGRLEAVTGFTLGNSTFE